MHPRSPGSQTEGESEAPQRRPVWACSPRGRPLPWVRGAARPPVRRNRETLSRSPRDPVTVTALPPPREPRSRRYQLPEALHARAAARSPPGTRWRSLPGPRGRRSPPTRSPLKDYSSHHATRGRATLTPWGAEDEARPAGRAACWASSF